MMDPNVGSGAYASWIPHPRYGWWRRSARLGLAVLACGFAGAGQAQERYDNLDHAVNTIIREIVEDGNLRGQSVFVGMDDFFEEETGFYLRPRLSEMLRAKCRTALTQNGVGHLEMVESEEAWVLHGRWWREAHESGEYLHLRLFIARPVEGDTPPQEHEGEAGLVPIDGVVGNALKPTLRDWGDSVVRQLERDLPGSGSYRLHIRPFEVHGATQPERLSRRLRNHWRQAFTGSRRFRLVGSAGFDGELVGEVVVTDEHVEVGLYVEDTRGQQVAAAFVAPDKGLFPPGIIGPDVAAELAQCAGLVEAERLGDAKACYEGVRAGAPGDAVAVEGVRAGLERIARVERDDAAFARAEAEGTASAYAGYRSSNPQGRHVEEAARREEERRAGREFRDCAECPELVVVPEGSFMMGSPSSESGRFDNEGPVHRVTIGRPFAVGVKEVTRGEYGRFVSATGHASGDSCWTYEGGEWQERSGRSWRNPGFGQTDEHPVVCVNWNDAKAYVRWLSRETGEAYRLLSEAEWEYVARGETGTARYWGESESGQCGYANGADESHGWTEAFCDDGHARTSPVGSYEANGFGLRDVLGNVWEWVEDCSNGSYGGAPSDGSAWESGDCSRRVERGGTWYGAPRYLRSAVRFRNPLGNRNSDVGFRIARTLTP